MAYQITGPDYKIACLVKQLHVSFLKLCTSEFDFYVDTLSHMFVL